MSAISRTLQHRATPWVVLSCVVHLGLLVVSPRRAPAPTVDVTPTELEFEELESWSEPAAPAEPSQPSEPAAATAPTTAKPAAAQAPIANAVVPSQEPGASTSEASTAPVASHGSWSLSPFASQGIAILPAPNYAGANLPATKPQPEPLAPAPVSQTGGLKEALAQGDTARGLGRGGAAVSAAHLASAQAPNQGRLLLALTFDASGAAVSVQIADRSDGDPSWDEYAKAVLAHAKKKPSLTLPPGARGLVVTLSVESKVVMPSGASAGESAGFGKGKGDVSVSGGHFDLSDLGSQPKKRVSARVVRESVVN